MMKWIGAVLATCALAACAADTTSEDYAESGAFLTSSTDEALDPSDPPTNPDPLDAACPERSNVLSPRGLTFVIHVSKHLDDAEADLQHLIAVKRSLRPRDIFMVEHTSPILDRLRAAFPCNTIHLLAMPDEMSAALATGGRIDGIAVDWEGANVDDNAQAYTVNHLADFAKKIRAAGKQPGFVPVLPGAFDDGDVTTKSGMDYEIVQIQGRCQTSPQAFADGARGKLMDFKSKSHPLRDMGVEISMDSVTSADNHVGPERAADCTRAAYGKGVRAIYLYGNGQDHLVDYFTRLHNLGVRHRGS